jgi:hypothetical protein
MEIGKRNGILRIFNRISKPHESFNLGNELNELTRGFVVVHAGGAVHAAGELTCFTRVRMDSFSLYFTQTIPFIIRLLYQLLLFI